MLWRLFVGYRKAQADVIEAAFLDAGYTVVNVANAITTAIKSLGLDLPAHGTGVAGGAVQGDLDREASHWVSTLTSYAAQHPAKKGARAAGLQHNAAERAVAAQDKADHKMKQGKQKKKAYCEENGHEAIPATNICKNCGAEI